MHSLSHSDFRLLLLFQRCKLQRHVGSIHQWRFAGEARFLEHYQLYLLFIVHGTL